jgi:DNA-binding protein H-NS
MRKHNDLSKDKISILENMLERRSQDLQDARSALSKKITQVNQTAAEMGVTTETPDLFRGCTTSSATKV